MYIFMVTVPYEMVGLERMLDIETQITEFPLYVVIKAYYSM